MVEADIMRAPVVIASVAAITRPPVAAQVLRGTAQPQTLRAVSRPKLARRPWKRRSRPAR